MSDKTPLDRAGDAIKHVGHDVRDTVREAGHRSAAEGEQAKRDLAGDTMTPREKVGSALNQGKENVAAEIDHAKRDLRNT